MLITMKTRSSLCNLLLCIVWGVVMGCQTGDSAAIPSAQENPGTLISSLSPTLPLVVNVTLDGDPIEGVIVSQGGNTAIWTTNVNGQAMIALDPSVQGDTIVMASHPEARIKGIDIWLDPPDTEVTLSLKRFDTTDNPEYVFQPPGTPENNQKIDFCGHCHVTLDTQWHDSVHRTSASNPHVSDVYLGRSAHLLDVSACVAAGGSWEAIDTPGAEPTAERCVVGTPVRDLGTTGGCANCHAPGIDGEVGGRDLMEASGDSYDFGVHCDTCHRVESVHPGESEGVSGWLKVLRPIEINPLPILNLVWAPLTFGPNHDIANVQMGSVQRDHFHEATLCGGCHEFNQEVLAGEEGIDLARWPEGTLPIHSTFSEWKKGPMNPAAPCQSCHMPPDPMVTTGADQQKFPETNTGILTGWIRPPGVIKKHTWIGPRGPGGRMLQIAAAVFLSKEVTDGELVVEATVKNVGPGHAIPTG